MDGWRRKQDLLVVYSFNDEEPYTASLAPSPQPGLTLVTPTDIQPVMVTLEQKATRVEPVSVPQGRGQDCCRLICPLHLHYKRALELIGSSKLPT